MVRHLNAALDESRRWRFLARADPRRERLTAGGATRKLPQRRSVPDLGAQTAPRTRIALRSRRPGRPPRPPDHPDPTAPSAWPTSSAPTRRLSADRHARRRRRREHAGTLVYDSWLTTASTRTARTRATTPSATATPQLRLGATPLSPDSGSALLDGHREALGVLSTVAIATPSAGTGVGDLGGELAHADSHGQAVSLAPGTEPFRGPCSPSDPPAPRSRRHYNRAREGA
jgi:hypothetical protein